LLGMSITMFPGHPEFAKNVEQNIRPIRLGTLRFAVFRVQTAWPVEIRKKIRLIRYTFCQVTCMKGVQDRGTCSTKTERNGLSTGFFIYCQGSIYCSLLTAIHHEGLSQTRLWQRPSLCSHPEMCRFLCGRLRGGPCRRRVGPLPGASYEALLSVSSPPTPSTLSPHFAAEIS
jgi:hypothetical protein